jgi:hypothetical protein
MKTSTKLLLALASLAIIVLGLMAGNALKDQDQYRYISDRCWVQGGTMEGVTCKLPEDKRTPQEKVCVAMKGNYVIAKDKITGKEEFWCYSDEGKELKLPNLAGKEVVTMDDGTVLLRKK